MPSNFELEASWTYLQECRQGLDAATCSNVSYEAGDRCIDTKLVGLPDGCGEIEDII